jgi:hypothetical protein
MAGVTFVQKVGDVSGNNNASRTITMPSTAGPPSIPVDGNLLLALTAVQGGSGTSVTEPANWSAADVDVNSGSSTSKFRNVAAHKVASSESGVAYIWSNSPSRPTETCVLEVSGQDPTTPIVGAVTGSAVSTLAGVTTTLNGNLIVVAAVMDTAANTVTGVADVQGNTYTQRENIVTTAGTHDPNMYVFTAPQVTAGSTGTITLTIGGATTSNTVMAFAVQPPNPNTAHLLGLTGVGS